MLIMARKKSSAELYIQKKLKWNRISVELLKRMYADAGLEGINFAIDWHMPDPKAPKECDVMGKKIAQKIDSCLSNCWEDLERKASVMCACSGDVLEIPFDMPSIYNQYRPKARA
jgi:hypothetical protein